MISSLEVSNFLSIDHIHLSDLDALDVVGIVGSYSGLTGYSNGSGKSSLAESIWFVLTGNHRFKVDSDIIRTGETLSFVKIVLIDGKHRLSIDRRLKVKSKGKGTQSTAIVELDGEVQASSTIAANSFISSYLNISDKDFLSAFFFRQGEYDEFVKLRSGKRVSFLENFFGSTYFEFARSLTVKRSNKSVKEKDNLQGRLDALDEEIADLDEDSIREEQSKIKKKLKLLQTKRKVASAKLEKIERDLGTYSLLAQKKDELKITKENRKEIDNSIKTLVAAIDGYEKDIRVKQKKIPKEKDCVFKGKEKLQSLRKSVRDNLVRQGKISVQLETLNDKLSEVLNNQCSTCNRVISQSLRDRLQTEIANAIVDLKLKDQTILNTINALEKDIALLERKENQAKFRDKSRRGLEAEVSSINVDLSSARATLKEKQKQLSSFESDLDFIVAELTELQVIADELESKDALGENKTLWESRLAKVDKKVDDGEKRLGVLDDRLERLGSRRDLRNKVYKSWQKLNAELSDLVLLSDIFNKCRFAVLSTGIAELQLHANEVISEIGAVHKEISLCTDRETQSGSIIDSLDVYLIDSKGKRLFEGLCGGEKNTVVFSIRVALARYKLSRMDSKVDFLILDEVFGALDSNSRREMVAAINMFRKSFSQIFTISHTDVQDMFNHLIEVEMVDDVTRLKTYN